MKKQYYSRWVNFPATFALGVLFALLGCALVIVSPLAVLTLLEKNEK